MECGIPDPCTRGFRITACAILTLRRTRLQDVLQTPATSNRAPHPLRIDSGDTVDPERAVIAELRDQSFLSEIDPLNLIEQVHQRPGMPGIDRPEQLAEFP